VYGTPSEISHKEVFCEFYVAAYIHFERMTTSMLGKAREIIRKIGNI
jgi:hypothetical protein